MNFRFMSYTGSSAFLINGKTIHSSMRLPYYLRNSDPKDGLKQFADAFKSVSFILIDEISLLGLWHLGFISKRLQLLYGNEKPFGGLGVILMGDFSQLRPIGDVALYSKIHDPKKVLDTLEEIGATAYAAFNKGIIFDEQMRQLGEEEARFRDLLLRVRNGKLLDSDVEMLNTRCEDQFRDDELIEFNKIAYVLFSDHYSVDAYNAERLALLDSPAVELFAKVSRLAPASYKNTITLKVGARVVLTDNLWVDGGLYNGSVGTVTRISPESSVVFVRFDDYRGRTLLCGDIPIVRTKCTEFDKPSKKNFGFEQFPLKLGFAGTVHAAQGRTATKICIGLPREPRPGEGPVYNMWIRESPSLFFVALSRVKCWDDFILARPFRAEYAKGKGEHHRLWNMEEDRIRDMEKNL